MGTCWTLPKVSAKLHILWILASARAFRKSCRIMKPETNQKRSGIFNYNYINYILLFFLSQLHADSFKSFLFFKIIILKFLFLSLPVNWLLPPPTVGWKRHLKPAMFGEETSWQASSSLYTSLDGLPWCFVTGCTADRWQLPPCHSRPQKQHLATMADALGMEISFCCGCCPSPLFYKDLCTGACLHACMCVKFGPGFFFYLGFNSGWFAKAVK